ncbi:MAG TPA: hypothetical protein VJQ56_13160, partial [Blastocatellia bacterium]|nr:hypothetical protein [Blastocatellia bacterium]
MTIFISCNKRPTSFLAALVALATLLAFETQLIIPASASNEESVMARTSPPPITSAGLGSRLDASTPKAERTIQSKARQAYGQLPIAFEANCGQTDSRAKFLSRANGYALFLTADEAVMALRVADSGPRNAGSQKAFHLPPDSQPAIINSRLASLRMKYVGASRKARITGVGEMAARSNYFIGNDPAKWQTGVPTYAKVKYERIYPGVDLVFYGNQRELEYDFIVAPG